MFLTKQKQVQKATLFYTHYMCELCTSTQKFKHIHHLGDYQKPLFSYHSLFCQGYQIIKHILKIMTYAASFS